MALATLPLYPAPPVALLRELWSLPSRPRALMAPRRHNATHVPSCKTPPPWLPPLSPDRDTGVPDHVWSWQAGSLRQTPEPESLWLSQEGITQPHSVYSLGPAQGTHSLLSGQRQANVQPSSQGPRGSGGAHEAPNPALLLSAHLHNSETTHSFPNLFL